MTPSETGQKYDQIADWWQQNVPADYGMPQFEKALKFCTLPKTALDVGCGAGGRFIDLLEQQSILVTGLDVSLKMIELAQIKHPKQTFLHTDICRFETEQTFDFIWAWDSLFHLPYDQQKQVVAKLCQMLNDKGVLMFTFGNDEGFHEDTWHQETFYYSSIGVEGNLQILAENGVTCQHLEIDQFPDLRHAYLIGTKSS